MLILVTSCLLVLSFSNDKVLAFPQGAPTEACELLSPKRGHHSMPQPLSESPYHFIQYARDYRRGDMIGGKFLFIIYMRLS